MLCRIWCFHDDHSEDGCLLGCKRTKVKFRETFKITNQDTEKKTKDPRQHERWIQLKTEEIRGSNPWRWRHTYNPVLSILKYINLLDCLFSLTSTLRVLTGCTEPRSCCSCHRGGRRHSLSQAATGRVSFLPRLLLQLKFLQTQRR